MARQGNSLIFLESDARKAINNRETTQRFDQLISTRFAVNESFQTADPA